MDNLQPASAALRRNVSRYQEAVLRSRALAKSPVRRPPRKKPTAPKSPASSAPPSTRTRSPRKSAALARPLHLVRASDVVSRMEQRQEIRRAKRAEREHAQVQMAIARQREQRDFAAAAAKRRVDAAEREERKCDGWANRMAEARQRRVRARAEATLALNDVFHGKGDIGAGEDSCENGRSEEWRELLSWRLVAGQLQAGAEVKGGEEEALPSEEEDELLSWRLVAGQLRADVEEKRDEETQLCREEEEEEEEEEEDELAPLQDNILDPSSKKELQVLGRHVAGRGDSASLEDFEENGEGGTLLSWRLVAGDRPQDHATQEVEERRRGRDLISKSNGLQYGFSANGGGNDDDGEAKYSTSTELSFNADAGLRYGFTAERRRRRSEQSAPVD